MYLSFYGLKEKPFNATPDPKFLCLTPGHREALAQLVYSVQETRGFLVLTGEVGTGKTTLLQAFPQRLNGKGSAIRLDAVHELGQGLAVSGREAEKLRIWRRVERLLFEPVKAQIHRSSGSGPAA